MKKIGLPLIFVFFFAGRSLYAEELILAPIDIDAGEETSYREEAFDERGARAEHRDVDGVWGDAAEILSRIPAVRVSDNGSRLQRKTASFRGAGSQDIIVRYMGVTLNALSDAGADLSLIPGRLLSSIELYGNGSTGANGAVGGLIDLNAELSDAPFGAALDISSLHDFSLFGRGQKKNDFITIDGAVFGDISPGRFHFIDEQGSHHIREHNGAVRFGAQIIGETQLREATLSAFSLFSRIERQEAGMSEYPSKYRNASQEQWLSLSRFKTEVLPIKVGQSTALFETGLSHRAAGFAYDNPTAFIGGAHTHSENLENRTTIYTKGSFLVSDISRTGIELGYDAQIVDSENLSYGNTSNERYVRHFLALSGTENIVLFNDRLELDGSFRLDWLVSQKPLLTAYLGVHGRPHESLELWASSGLAQRYPSFDECYYRTEYMRGNEDLEPQKALLNELGASWHFKDWLKLAVTGFYNLHYSLIRFIPVTPYLYEAQNITDVTARGVSVSASSRLWRGLSLRADYGFVDAKTSEGYEMPTTARHYVYSQLSWDDKIWHAGLDFQYNSRVPRNMSGTSFNDPRLRLNADVSMTFYPGWKLALTLSNLLNNMRSEDVLQRPLPGRQVMISLINSLPKSSDEPQY